MLNDARNQYEARILANNSLSMKIAGEKINSRLRCVAVNDVGAISKNFTLTSLGNEVFEFSAFLLVRGFASIFDQ